MAQWTGTNSAVFSSGAVNLVANPSLDTVINNNAIIKAASFNTSVVYVGLNNSVTPGTNDATDGYPIYPGEALSVSRFACGTTGLSSIFLIAVSGATGPQKVHYALNMDHTAG